MNNMLVSRASEILKKYPDVVVKLFGLEVPEGADMPTWVAGAVLFDVMAMAKDGSVAGLGSFRTTLRNPAAAFARKAKAGEFDELSEEEYKQKLDAVEVVSRVWMDRDTISMASLFSVLVGCMSDGDMEELRKALTVSDEKG